MFFCCLVHEDEDAVFLEGIVYFKTESSDVILQVSPFLSDYVKLFGKFNCFMTFVLVSAVIAYYLIAFHADLRGLILFTDLTFRVFNIAPELCYGRVKF